MLSEKLGKPVGNLLLSYGSTPPPEYEKVQINMQTAGKKWRKSGCCISMDTERLIAQINETYIGKLTFIVGFMKVFTRHTQELHENASQ